MVNLLKMEKMKNPKIFRVEAEKVVTIDSLVIAENSNEAELMVEQAIKDGELEFEDSIYEEVNVTTSRQIDIDPKIEKEIKDFGILNSDVEVVYDPNIIDEIAEAHRHEMRENYLKQNHLELSLGV